MHRASPNPRTCIRVANSLSVTSAAPIRTRAGIRVDTPARVRLVGEERIHPMRHAMAAAEPCLFCSPSLPSTALDAE